MESFAISPTATAQQNGTLASYTLESQRVFEDFRQVLAQIAGLLVLAATGGKTATPHHPMLEISSELYRETADRLKMIAAPPEAGHHFSHLQSAARALEETLRDARAHLNHRIGKAGIDKVLLPLRVAQVEMNRVSRLLPGFEMVDFGQACCAEHRVPVKPD
jgi:hypothetical protein